MSFGFGVGDIIALSQLALKIYTDVRHIHSVKRESDDFKQEIDSLGLILQKCEQLVYPGSHGSLYETRELTQTVSACSTNLKQLEQLLKEGKIDDGTSSRRISQLKRKLYVSRTDIVRLRTNFALWVSQRPALFLAHKPLHVPDDASAFLKPPVEEPIDIPISGAASSIDETRVIYRICKDLGAMRGPHKRWLDGRDKSLSKPLWVQGATGSGKSTFLAFINEGLRANFMTSTICYSYGLGDQELCDSSISTISTNHRSQDSYSLHGLDKGAAISSSSLSETRSSLSDFYDSCTICEGTNYISPFSRHKDFSYGSWANHGSATTSSATIRSSNIWSYGILRKWFFRPWSLQKLGHAMSSVSLRTSKVLTLVSPILFTSPASADASHCGSQNDSVPLKTGPHDYNSWFQALDNVQRDLLYLWTHPTYPPSMSNDNSHTNAEAQPSTVLLACFLCTSCVALVAQAGRKDPYQTHIVGFCAMISSIGGALLTVNVQVFVFLYLFWGCLGGLVISLFLHRVGAVTALEQRGGLWGKARVDEDDDGLRRELGDEKS